ncbi:MFS transporter [Streptomyces sp. CG4]|uniref:MFS transporter n=1 Tax=Streptomyces sp. CG4 TaxID=408783 RepID=UPI0034E26830
MLDFASVPRAEPVADAPAAQPDPRIALRQTRSRPEPGPPAPLPAPPAYTLTPSPAPHAVSPSGPHPRRWWGPAALVPEANLGTAWLFLDREVHLGPTGPAALPVVHGLFFGGLLLFGGQLADRIGPRRTLITGLVGSVPAALLGGTATDAGRLMSARALQGVSAALITPSLLALVSTGFTDPRERRRAFGNHAAFGVGGAALMALPDAGLLEALSWRICLYAAVPPAVLALVGTVTLVRDGSVRPGARFDVLGTVLGLAGVAGLTYGLGQGARAGWTDPLVVALVGRYLTMILSGGAPDGGAAADLPALFVIGFGLGIAFMLVFAVATDALAPGHSGGASAALIATQHLGGVIGSALFSAVVHPRHLWYVYVAAGVLLAGPLVGRRARTTGSEPAHPASA